MKLMSPAFAVFTIALGVATGAYAQNRGASPYPPGLTTRAANLAAFCQSEGGRTVNGDRPFVYTQYDLTGDGRADFVMDESGFGCTNRSAMAIGPNGGTVEVFDGATGRSLFRAEAYRVGFTSGARPQLFLTLRGAICSPNALTTTTCQRSLSWDAARQTFTGMPTTSLAQAAPASRGAPTTNAPFDPLADLPAPAPKAGAQSKTSPPPAAGSKMTLTKAEEASAFRAAGFKQTRRGWERCEDPGTTSYSPGAIEAVTDLNADGRPEVVITEGGSYCFGNTGTGMVILSKQTNGGWATVLDQTGVFSPLKTRANGWLEIMVGGPGFTQPVYRFNGKEYVLNRTIKE